MNEELKNIIKKVQKLYRLADGAGTEEEAHTAMRMAKELIAKYELNMADVENLADEDCEQTIIIIKKNHIPAHCRILLHAMSMLFQCRTIIRRNYDYQSNRQGLIFIGVGADALLARQTFEFLLEFAKRKIRDQRIANKNDYLYGFSVSIFDRVFAMQRQEESTENALVPLKNVAINRYVDKHYQNLTKMRSIRKRSASTDLVAGMSDGNTASLQRQVVDNDRKQIGSSD